MDSVLRFQNKKTKRLYFVSDDGALVNDGLPVLTKKEAEGLRDLSEEQINLVLNLKLELSDEKETPQEEVGYKKKPEYGKDFETPRYKLAEKYAKLIAEDLKTKSIKGIR